MGGSNEMISRTACAVVLLLALSGCEVGDVMPLKQPEGYVVRSRASSFWGSEQHMELMAELGPMSVSIIKGLPAPMSNTGGLFADPIDTYDVAGTVELITTVKDSVAFRNTNGPEHGYSGRVRFWLEGAQGVVLREDTSTVVISATNVPRSLSVRFKGLSRDEAYHVRGLVAEWLYGD